MKINFDNSDDQLQKKIKDLLKGPKNPEAEFLFSGCTFGEIFGMAWKLQERFSSSDLQNKAVCLSTQNRSVIAAAILAALSCEGPHLLIPYSDSDIVLNEMHQQVPYDTAIADVHQHFPDEISLITVSPETFPASGLQRKNNMNLDFEFLSLFTGGSTGKPRIWPKTIKNLFSEAFYLSDKFHFSPDDRIVATVPPYHIYGILFSVLIPLVSSACVMAGTPTFPHEITNAITLQKATVLVSVPMHYRTFGNNTIPNHSLRIAFSSAGALDKTDSENFTKQTRTGITEIYGSTETGGIAYRCRAQDDAALSLFETVDVEIIGEKIHVRSDYISPNLTRDEDGFYQTGDRGGKFDSDRFILYGRSDGIVKIGGKRVDLEEIREKILSLPNVTDAMILSNPCKKGRENEIAAVLEGKIHPKQVREYLSGQLEPYAQPRSIKVVDRIPRNNMGKYNMEMICKLFH
ncbi:MAG: acyl-CoA synthetase [Desulfobacterium sp.]|nr:acyl-CoA synthetase [Desulfobacterium sp.]